MVAGGRRVVLVSGVPGAGKSTLAGPLAAGLGFALLGKDRIKETLHGALGAPEAGQPYLRDRPWTKWLGGAAMELIWALAATSVPADVARVVDEVLARFERLGAGGPDADLVGLGESSP